MICQIDISQFLFIVTEMPKTHYYTSMTPFDALVLKDVFFQMFHFEKDVINDPRHGPLNNPVSMMDGYLQFSDKSVSSSAMDSNPKMDKQSTSRSLLPCNSNCLSTNDYLETIDLEDIQPDVVFPDSSSTVSESSSSNVNVHWRQPPRPRIIATTGQYHEKFCAYKQKKKILPLKPKRPNNSNPSRLKKGEND